MGFSFSFGFRGKVTSSVGSLCKLAETLLTEMIEVCCSKLKTFYINELLIIFVIAGFKRSINPITNPNPVNTYGYTYTYLLVSEVVSLDTALHSSVI
jgi:hypothetical protein